MLGLLGAPGPSFGALSGAPDFPKTFIFIMFFDIFGLGPSWLQLRLSCFMLGHLGPSLGRLGAVLGPLGAILGSLGASLGPPWALLGSPLGPSWTLLGTLGATLGASWPTRGPRLAHLKPPYAHLGSS